MVGKLMGQYVYSVFAGEFFWRDKQKHEVDVVREANLPLPIEVKYQNQITSSDLKNLIIFMKKFDAERGILVTKSLFEKKKYR